MTIIRTAFFEAELNDAQKKDFYNYMKTEVLPIVEGFPNNRGVILNEPEFIEAESNKNLLLMLQHSYDNKSDMEAALNSDNRVASMNATKVMIEKYNINVHHVNFLRD